MQINHKCQHVGPIKSRCLAEITCSKEESAYQTGIQKQHVMATQKYTEEAEHEWGKQYPTRYPYNANAIGIEVVGKAVGPLHHEIYPNPTPQQNDAVRWLVPALLDALKLTPSDVYRHPMLSRKNVTEAQGVTW